LPPGLHALANPAIAHHDQTQNYRLLFFLLRTLPIVSAAAIFVFDALARRRKALRNLGVALANHVAIIPVEAYNNSGKRDAENAKNGRT
jgi:hypothetical protein